MNNDKKIIIHVQCRPNFFLNIFNLWLPVGYVCVCVCVFVSGRLNPKVGYSTWFSTTSFL
jgi:hypothetical protein